MILYSDEYTRKLELEGKWIDCVRYSHEKLTADRKNVSLFLKLSVNTWYTLTLDGPVLSLKKGEYDTLTDMLCHCFKYFNSAFSANENCQWLFGYMMEVRPDLFLNSGVEYTAIEQQGKIQIDKEIERKRKRVSEHISEYFDESQEVDKYFIEILTTNF